jgi:ubiquinol-cytochrome c reductase cytochrome b subunit
VLIAEGVELIKNEAGCTDCHRFQDAGEAGSAPDLTDYGTRQWLAAFIKNPGAESFYGEKHHMPAFEGQRSDREIELIATWLRGDWFRADESASKPGRSPAASN